MSHPINIRNVVETDLDIIYDFVCALENEVIDKKAFTAIFLQNIQDTDKLYVLAETKEKAVGFISFHVQWLLHHGGKVGEIQEFYLDADHRNQGIGRRLIDEVKTYAANHQLKSIEVTTGHHRSENVEVYQKLGFNLSHHKFTIYL